MMFDWNTYQQQLLAGIGQIGKISPDIVRGYRELSEAGSKTGKLDAKTRELIALAVAVTRQCDGCITGHTDAAVKHGATREEVAEALGVHLSERRRGTGLFGSGYACLFSRAGLTSSLRPVFHPED